MAVNLKVWREALQEGLSRESAKDTYQRDLMEWVREMGNREIDFARRLGVNEERTAYEVRRKEEEFKRRYLDREPVYVNYDWAIVPMTTYELTRPAVDDKQYDTPAPRPRDELEERCRAKGLDPNFARELDLD